MFGRGWRGFEGPRERIFEKGDLKYVVLDLLAEKPRHGYDVIQALSDRMGGNYTPSPGSVYPILQMLEDLGHVRAEAREGRKVYTLAESGRAFLEENRRQVDEIWERIEGQATLGGHGVFHGDFREAMHELHQEFHSIGRLLAMRGWQRKLTPEKLRRVREILTQARRDIETLLSE